VLQRRRFLSLLSRLTAAAFAKSAWSTDLPLAPPTLGPLLFDDDFRGGLTQWHLETERPGRISAQQGVLDIEVPAGATLWFDHELHSPLAIAFEASAVAAGGRYDRVSDLNCFWMARNRDGVTPVYSQQRSGRFEDYNDLLAYYVGLGGNSNTTTRFRRYIGDSTRRPLLPQHDLSAPDVLLVPNRRQRITLIANGSDIQYWRDDRLLFRYSDPSPYTNGWFALRTTQSHLRIERFRIHALAEGTR
jgi:hypothetical protein